MLFLAISKLAGIRAEAAASVSSGFHVLQRVLWGCRLSLKNRLRRDAVPAARKIPVSTTTPRSQYRLQTKPPGVPSCTQSSLSTPRSVQVYWKRKDGAETW